MIERQRANASVHRVGLAAELLRAGTAVELPIGGTSMRPLLRPGDVVVVTPARGSSVAPGDVVLVEVEGHLLCHRVVYKTAGRIVTRGDAAAPDDPLPLDAVLGRVDLPPSPHTLYCAARALLRL